MNKFNELVESVMNENKSKYLVSVNGTEKKMNLDLNNKSKTIEQIIKTFKSVVGTGHDGTDLTLNDNGAILTLEAYPGGPSWTIFIKEN